MGATWALTFFFVISGFLITTLVANGIHRGTFKLPEFYFRRAKRLLPAAYVTFLVTALFAPWFLNQQELRDFATQVVGAITFTGNIVLWQQTGYFEGVGDLKPLLHVWSLAIEEQYYFVLPAALLFTPPSRWLRGAVVLVLLSLGLCVVGGMVKPIATFYLLPTRAWELLIGSVGALWLLEAQVGTPRAISGILKLLFFPALLCLLALPFMPLEGTHPGVNAFLICFATLVVILRNSPWLNCTLPARILACIGDFSYSLYLVHWPIIAFMKNAWVGRDPELPLDLRFGALTLSFSVAFLLYRFIEDPIRKSSFDSSRSLLGKAALSSVLLVLITPISMQAMPIHFDFAEARKRNYGFGEACEYKTSFSPKAECQSKRNPTLLVWGDSYAMHLVPGLADEWKHEGVMQATRSACGPFLGLAPFRMVHPEHGGIVMDRAWAESCIGFNQSVIDFLHSAPTIDVVVLSSPFSAYVNLENYEQLSQDGQSFVTLPGSVAASQAALRRTVKAIRALGKKVVIIAPLPSSNVDIGGCLERQLSGKVAIGGRQGCTIDRANYETKRSDVLDFLHAVLADADVAVIRFDSWLCDSHICQTLINGTMIYRDGGHLSIAGSKLLAKRMQLAQLIRAQAK